MSAVKSERLMNLLIMLLVQRRYIGKDGIRAALYPDASDEAFEKMFERDKEELRSLGVPIEVVHGDPLFEDDLGYRVSADEFQLPEIELDAAEAAVVGVAARVWEHAGMSRAAGAAGRKLAADQIGPGDPADHVDLNALDLVLPRLGAEEPSYEGFTEAAWTRTPVTFTYQRAGAAPTVRRLEPWGVVRYSGRWYVVGRDQDRDDERVFRLSRVVGTPSPHDAPGSFTRPADIDAAEVVRRLAPPPTSVEATVLVSAGAGHLLRRYASATAPARDGWDRLTLTYTGTDLVGDLLAHGPDVVVEAPASLRAAVVDRLTTVAEEDR